MKKQEELEKKARELERRERELESHSLGPGACKSGEMKVKPQYFILFVIMAGDRMMKSAYGTIRKNTDQG